MTHVIQPFHLLVTALAGWLNRHQQAGIDYLIEENRVLKEQLEGKRLRFTDEQRMRLRSGHPADWRPITCCLSSIFQRGPYTLRG